MREFLLLLEEMTARSKYLCLHNSNADSLNEWLIYGMHNARWKCPRTQRDYHENQEECMKWRKSIEGCCKAKKVVVFHQIHNKTFTLRQKSMFFYLITKKPHTLFYVLNYDPHVRLYENGVFVIFFNMRLNFLLVLSKYFNMKAISTGKDRYLGITNYTYCLHA